MASYVRIGHIDRYLVQDWNSGGRGGMLVEFWEHQVKMIEGTPNDECSLLDGLPVIC